MTTTRNKKFAIFAAVLLLAFVMSIMPAVSAQTATRKTTAYLSVAPELLGLGQTMTVNLWVYPSPATLTFDWLAKGFQDMEITFTRPDGSTDTFMPIDGSGGLAPGESEMIGAIWFHYTPNQVGTWSAQFSMPGQAFGLPGDEAYYESAVSEVVTFTVQADPVNAGLLNGWPWAALPGTNEYWERPIYADNREWYQIGGDWLQTNYDGGLVAGGGFNPYSTGPESAHILWTRPASPGGLIGGDWGSLSYSTSQLLGEIAMMGNVYYSVPGGKFHCVDIRTGELVYEAPGAVGFGHHLRQASVSPITQETQAAGVIPSIWEVGYLGTWNRYDPMSGVLLQSITNAPIGFTAYATKYIDGSPIQYFINQFGWNTTILNRLAINTLYCWDMSKVVGNDWMTGVVWNTSLKQPDGTGPGEGNRGSGLCISADYTVGMVLSTGEDVVYGFDLATGAQIYTKKHDWQFMSAGYQSTPNGLHINWDSAEMKVKAIDIKTGNEVWESPMIGEYPWGSQNNLFGTAMAYGNLYTSAYDGYVYCLDQTNGNLKWKSKIAMDTDETVFGNIAPYALPVIADGKLYLATSEHSPTQPRIRFNRLYCIDAFTGDEIWSMYGALEPYGKIIHDGYLVGIQENDGLIYCFGKGKTETTVMASPKVVAKGNSVLIEGTVMDMSPAQEGTPAISDADMSEWMDYKHMQKPIPMATGVPVTLTAVAESGSAISIGIATSDMSGFYSMMWTPPAAGKYTIIASFDGSKSYWPSYVETAVGVTAGPSAAPAFKPLSGPAETATMDMTLIVAAVAAVAVIAVAVLVLRRRK